MKKNDFNLSKLGKTVKVIPIVLTLLVGKLNCAAESFLKTPNSKYTSVGNTTLAYEQNALKYSENEILETLNTILSSDLNQLNSYSRSEASVQNDIAKLLSKRVTSILPLARLLKSGEDYTYTHSGLSQKRINEIIESNFSNSTNQENQKIVSMSARHDMHLGLDTLVLTLFQADEAEISYLDEGDFHNEYLSINRNGKRDLRQESMDVCNSMFKDVLSITQYDYAVRGLNGEKVTKQISSNLDKIKKIIEKKHLSEKDKKKLLKIASETADLFPEDFGTIAMCRGLFGVLVSDYAMNKLLTNVANLGYNIDNIKPEILAEQTQKVTPNVPVKMQPIDTFQPDFVKQNRKTTINPSLSFSATNLHSDVNIGLSGTAPISNKWDATTGVDFSVIKDYEQNEPEYRVLGGLEFDRRLKNGSDISVGVKGGVQTNGKNFSTPVGGDIGYRHQFSENLSVGVKVGSIVNPQKEMADFIGDFSIRFKIGSVAVNVGVKGGYSLNWADEKKQDDVTKPEVEPTDPVEPEQDSEETPEVTDPEVNEEEETPENTNPEDPEPELPDEPDATELEETPISIDFF